MKNVAATPEVTQESAVHPMKKSYTFISSKHVDLDNLNIIEAGAMSLALVLAVTIGVLTPLA